MGTLIPKVVVSQAIRYKVTIINGLPEGEELDFRCQSKDVDLGLQQLTKTGKTFCWMFKMNFFGTTLFFCHFYWKDKNISFPVFKGHVQGYVCQQLVYWEVRPDGFYFHCDDNDSIYKYSW